MEEILHHLLYMKPYEKWEILPSIFTKIHAAFHPHLVANLVPKLEHLDVLKALYAQRLVANPGKKNEAEEFPQL